MKPVDKSVNNQIMDDLLLYSIGLEFSFGQSEFGFEGMCNYISWNKNKSWFMRIAGIEFVVGIWKIASFFFFGKERFNEQMMKGKVLMIRSFVA